MPKFIGTFKCLLFRDHFVYTSSQWETTLQHNVISHWLGAYTKWSLICKLNAVIYTIIFIIHVISEWDSGLDFPNYMLGLVDHLSKQIGANWPPLLVQAPHHTTCLDTSSHWKTGVVMMPTLSALVAPEVFQESSLCQLCQHWWHLKFPRSHHCANSVSTGGTWGFPGVVMMPTLSSLVTPEVVVTTTSCATSDDKVGILTDGSWFPVVVKLTIEMLQDLKKISLALLIRHPVIKKLYRITKRWKNAEQNWADFFFNDYFTTNDSNQALLIKRANDQDLSTL